MNKSIHGLIQSRRVKAHPLEARPLASEDQHLTDIDFGGASVHRRKLWCVQSLPKREP
jgi:hypothetical protein